MSDAPRLPGKWASGLPVDDAAGLMAALADPIDSDDLQQVMDGNIFIGSSVHATAIGRLFGSPADAALAQQWADACRRLAELQAPVTTTFGDGVAMSLLGPAWPSDPEVIGILRDLASHYMRVGMLDLNAPAPGNALSKAATINEDGFSWAGLKPLAIAITGKNPAAVRWLCDQGVSFDVGTVLVDMPPFDAMALAEHFEAAEVLSVLREVVMQRRLAQVGRPEQTGRPACAHEAGGRAAAPRRRKRDV